MASPKAPEPDRIKRSIGLTVNIGNFESIRYDVGLEVSYTGEAGDTREEAAEKVMNDLREQLYEGLATEISNFRELRAGLVGGE